MRGARLLVRGRAVAVQTPLRGAHLEEAEVLAVPRGREEPGLAPGDLERLGAVAPEDVADRLPGRERAQAPPLAGGDRVAKSRDRACAPRERALGAPEGAQCDRAGSRRAEELRTALEETDGSASPPEARLLRGETALDRRRGAALPGARARRLRRALGLCSSSAREERECAQRGNEGSQRRTSWSGTGARRAHRRRSCHSSRSSVPDASRSRRKRLTESSRRASRSSTHGTTCSLWNGRSRARPRASRARLRGRDSNPNFLVQSQASYR